MVNKFGCLCLLGLVACDPGAYVKDSAAMTPEVRKAYPLAEHDEDTVGDSARGNVTNDIQSGLDTFAAAGKKAGTRNVRATIYYIPDEKDFSGPKTARVYGPKGQVIAKVSERFKAALKLQGSGILEDGRTVNVFNLSGTRHFVTPFKYGVGNSPDRPLVPFRSLAVDIKYWQRQGYKVTEGDKVYIKATDGMKIPGSNEIHNGVWELADSGHGIKGNRIDMFFGTMHWRKAMRYLADKSNFVENFLAHEEATSIGNRKENIGMNFLI